MAKMHSSTKEVVYTKKTRMQRRWTMNKFDDNAAHNYFDPYTWLDAWLKCAQEGAMQRPSQPVLRTMYRLLWLRLALGALISLPCSLPLSQAAPWHF